MPYKGTAPSLVDMIAGRTQFLMGAVLTAVPDVKEGRLSTLTESDLPGFVVTTWQGISATAGTPRPVLARINAEFVKAVRSPELKPRIEQQDMDPTGMTIDAFTASYRGELARWTKVAKDAGLKAD